MFEIVIEQAAAKCRAAWKAAPQATWAWCLHHAVRVEPLTEPFENRIVYILSYKPKSEQITRLNNFRPVLSKLPRKLLKAWADREKAGADFRKAWADYLKAEADYLKAEADYDKVLANLNKAWADANIKAAHLADVPNHTWNGKGIF